MMTRVLLTGANGEIGRYLVPYLRKAHYLRIGVGPAPRDNMGEVDFQPTDDVCELDLLKESSLLSAMGGMDAVVHLAGQREVRASWEELSGPNIQGIYNVFEAAHRAGVRKVVFASSNHVIGGYDARRLWPVDAEVPVWPDSLYGVTKAFGEALARYMADRYCMQVVCLRIGWVLEHPHNEQALRLWLSPRDLCQLVDRSLDADVHFGIYYGTSGNSRCKYDLEAARRDLGYSPVDDSEGCCEGALGQEIKG